MLQIIVRQIGYMNIDTVKRAENTDSVEVECNDSATDREVTAHHCIH